MNFRTLFTASVALGAAAALSAHEFQSSRVDGHAPISVMGDHLHKKGESMLSLRYMAMDMSGMRSGSSSVSTGDVFAAGFTVSPVDMQMEMFMLGAMYAPSDTVTLMAMTSRIESEMDHEIFGMAAPLIGFNEGSRNFTTRSSGWGDLKLSALVKLHEAEKAKSHFSIGISAPTGSFDARDKVPGPGGRLSRQLPAPMQHGSGTWDLLSGITYLHQEADWSWGAQANTTLRLEDENSNGYRLGHRLNLLAWVAKPLSESFSVSAKIEYSVTGELKGSQDGIATGLPFAPTRRTVTTAFGENFGGEVVDLGLGVNYMFKEGSLAGNRIALEWELPLHRDLNGFQLETDSVVTLGWQLAF